MVKYQAYLLSQSSFCHNLHHICKAPYIEALLWDIYIDHDSLFLDCIHILWVFDLLRMLLVGSSRRVQTPQLMTSPIPSCLGMEAQDWQQVTGLAPAMHSPISRSPHVFKQRCSAKRQKLNGPQLSKLVYGQRNWGSQIQFWSIALNLARTYHVAVCLIYPNWKFWDT